MGIVHFIPTLGLRDQIGKNQPRCVRKLSFSNAKDSDGLPFKRLKLDEDSTVVNTGDWWFFKSFINIMWFYLNKIIILKNLSN